MCFMKSTWKIEVTVCYEGTQLPSWQPTAEMALEENPDKYLVFHVGGKLASNVGVSEPIHQKNLYRAHT